MKICALTQSYADTGGGVRTILQEQRAWCQARGIEHVLIVPGPQDSTARDGVLTTHTVRSPFVPGSSVYRLLLRSGHVLRLLERELPDVIEVHCTYNLPWTALHHRRRRGGLVAAFFNTDLSIGYVETPVRNSVGRLSPTLGRGVGRAARAAAERYLRALYRRCDAVIAISPAMQQRLDDIGVPGSHCVPLGVDTDTFHPTRRDDALRTGLGLGPGDTLLVYAGRLDGEKRPDIVMAAFELVRAAGRDDIHLVLVGEGPMRDVLEGRAARAGNARVLHYMQDRAELARLLASADVYVTAMAHETFGLSVVEAQSSGLPVVGVRAGALVDRVHAGEGVLVAPGDAAAMARVILETPRDAWSTMGQAARTRVESEFSWSRTFDTLQRIYAALRQDAA